MAEVRTYLREPRLKETIGEYCGFWTEYVLRESSPEQLAELLDEIAANFKDFKVFMAGEVGTNTRMGRLPVEALEQVLRDREGRVATERLYNWLGMFLDNGFRLLDRDIASLRFYLEWDAEALKALIAHAIETCLASGESCADVVDRRLFGARPFRYGHWCIQQALAAEEPEAESFYLRELVTCVTNGRRASGLTVERASAELAGDEALRIRFDELFERAVGSNSQPDDGSSLGSPDEPAERPRAHMVVAAPSSVAKAPAVGPPQLHRAAETYLGNVGDLAGKTPQERLVDFAGSSFESVDLLLAELEATIWRDDLPDCDDVVRLFDKGRVNLLVLPFAAGLHNLERSGRLSVGDLNEDQIRLAVTILYTLPQQLLDPDSVDGRGTYRPEWFKSLLRDDPALVANVLCRTAMKKLETGIQPAMELRDLWRSEDHREVAKLATLSVLDRFPPAKTDNGLQALCCSLHTALASCDWTDVGRLVEERLAQSGQPQGERTCWLIAGYLLNPKRCRNDLRTFTDDEASLKWLAMFLACAVVQRDNLARRLEPHDIEPLVVVSAAALTRHGLPERAFWAVSDLISTLGDDPSATATEALEVLADAADAKPWLAATADARMRQAGKRREQEYRHCHIEQVVQMLDNGSPANAGDLAALVCDELTVLSRRIRDGNTSDWRQFWNTDRHKHPTDPKHEDLCRDAVLSDLKVRLESLGIDAEPEGNYADEKRSDIWVSFAGFNVPVEIKRSCHSDLWTAIREQLMANYTRDPRAGGFGIYLVFWFGDTERCPPTRCSGWTPEKPDDVKWKLEQSLSDREKARISVCVVDVSVPARREPRVRSPGRNNR